ncbi:unnamed protein product [Candidula unifasciata]|uniref:Uncharacterized protein n=1 Tax=Candidula unifasciata TaxID=100452 RepID=A0A8S3Z9Q8_9EUPU|nr:unnamed protein product [Candidula unifasciata]
MNGDDTLDWAKKPAEPGNRKRAVSKKTIEGSPVSRFCPKCALEGSVSPIQLFQINDEEALLMCKNAACTFMQSTYWQSLIVKRSVSQLTVTNRRRKSLSSRSSHVSTPTSANTDTCLQSILKSSSQSRYSVNPTSLPGISPVSNLAGVTAGSQPPFKKLVSESSLEGKERKTLVPIAPFLSGHAHSFASFETNKLEHKLQQRNTLTQQQGPALSPKPTDIRKLFGADKWRVLSKRRACSLDSDSQSSSSSCYDSRPTTPDTSSSAKKVRSIVVPPETLSKLIDGSMKLEIRKTTNSGADIIFRSVKKVNSTVDYGKQPERNQLQTLNRPVSSASINSVPAVSVQQISGGDLEITPVGSLHDLVSSRGQQSDSASSHIEAINFHLQASSIKSHIEIINSHIQAINKAVGCSDLYVPIDFSHLCQKFSVDILNEPASAQEGDQNSLVTSGHNEFQVVVDTSSFDYSSFKPVGYLDRQIIEPVLDSSESSSLISGSAEPTSDSSQCGGTQLSSSCS